MDKKTAFVGHPIAGDILGNVEKVLAICKEIHTGETIPVAPYLGSLQYLDDEFEDDRALGFEANLECFHRGYIDELWLYGDFISGGMGDEIRLALAFNIPIVLKTEGVKRDFINGFALEGLADEEENEITLEHTRAAKVGLTLPEWMEKGKELVALHEKNQANQISSYRGMSNKDITIFEDYQSWSNGGIMA